MVTIDVFRVNKSAGVACPLCRMLNDQILKLSKYESGSIKSAAENGVFAKQLNVLVRGLQLNAGLGLVMRLP